MSACRPTPFDPSGGCLEIPVARTDPVGRLVDPPFWSIHNLARVEAVPIEQRVVIHQLIQGEALRGRESQVPLGSLVKQAPGGWSPAPREPARSARTRYGHAADARSPQPSADAPDRPASGLPPSWRRESTLSSAFSTFKLQPPGKTQFARPHIILPDGFTLSKPCI